MTRQQLLDRIEALIKETGEEGETAHAVGCLHALAASMICGLESPLLALTQSFARQLVDVLKEQTENEMKVH